MVIDAHMHLWDTGRPHELSKLFGRLDPAERDAMLGGTATRFYALGDNSFPAHTHRK